MPRARSFLVLAASALVLAAAAGCRTAGGGISFVPSGGPPEVAAPATVRAQVGAGRLPVYGASLYSAGQEIYKELRQQESLMAFLACQGEPDFVEVVAHPGAPKIYLYYTRRGLTQTGTVEIYPSEGGFYAARPVDPELRGPGATPPPKPAPKPAPSRPAPAPKPPPEPEPEPPPPAPEPEPRWPEPTQQQRDDCPIEPWRQDCRTLCADDAPWEWCDYQE